MILLITAIQPEAKAILSAYSMKKSPVSSLSLYEEEHSLFRLLITGPGKLNAAMALTEYLSAFPYSEEDVFCNVGICGGSESTSVGNGFLCASVTEQATGRTLYPELYCHPFPEAQLFTSDSPVTTLPDTETSFEPLPILYDMEAYGMAVALFRKVKPSHCFFYKIVSDFCDGQFPDARTVTGLLQPHIENLLSFLKQKEQDYLCAANQHKDLQAQIDAVKKGLPKEYLFSATMDRKLNRLLSYGLRAGFSENDLLACVPPATDSPHKKKETLDFLHILEDTLLQTFGTDKSCNNTVIKKILRPFQRIYIERGVLQHPTTQNLIRRFPHAHITFIDHYKDVFNRSGQDLHAQETEPALILAANHGTLFYPGAPVCQDFGETHFWYTSCIMNCLYGCDYCYLQGMYPCRNIVVFVNLEDYFKQLDILLEQHPIYLCCSYDSDLTGFCGLLPHAEAFCNYALTHPELRLELRTKSAALPFIRRLPAAKNIIIAFTLSPQEIIDRYEHFTPSLRARLNTAKEAARRGFSLRLCFDPILDVPNAPELYTALIDKTFSILQPEEITDISLGVFRLSKEYLKQLKKSKPFCALSHYPYEQTDGVCHYPPKRCDALLETVKAALYRHHIPEEKLFVWAPGESEEGVSYVTK